jgi:hypothetical protein
MLKKFIIFTIENKPNIDNLQVKMHELNLKGFIRHLTIDMTIVVKKECFKLNKF